LRERTKLPKGDHVGPPSALCRVSERPIERPNLPGWNGRYFHAANKAFAHYDFRRGRSIHEHFHADEVAYEVIEGELEVTIDGEAKIARTGLVAIVPSNVHPSVKALDTWSLTSLQQRLVKAGGRLVKLARYYWLQLADVI
jgi:mannose-6-phosphate isomerase-like protein (cupin superfamily)